MTCSIFLECSRFMFAATRNKGSAGESFRFSWKPETETRGATRAQACNLPAARRGSDSNGIYTILLLLGLLEALSELRLHHLIAGRGDLLIERFALPLVVDDLALGIRRIKS